MLMQLFRTDGTAAGTQPISNFASAVVVAKARSICSHSAVSCLSAYSAKKMVREKIGGGPTKPAGDLPGGQIHESLVSIASAVIDRVILLAPSN